MKKCIVLSIVSGVSLLLSSCFVPGIGMVGVGDEYDSSAFDAQMAQLDSEAVARRSAAGVSEQQYKTYEKAYLRNIRSTSDTTAAVEAARMEAGISKPALQQIFGGQSAPQSKASTPVTTKQRDPKAGNRTQSSQYPMGIAIPGKKGFVFSPYTKNVVDVTSIPSGTFVFDPTDSQKRIFRVP